MPNWNDLFKEINNVSSPLDHIRKKYLKKLAKYRKRSVIAYYSSFLTKKGLDTGIQDADKEMIMSAIHKIDREKGLDLILHTEGGDVAATESIVDYLDKMFGHNIEIFVPQIAMSAGTLIACAGRLIHMGKQSNLGPIDPHINGISAKLVLTDYKKAKEELEQNKNVIYWQIELQKTPPTYLALCQNAVTWSEELAKEWLSRNMFGNLSSKEETVRKVVEYLSDPEQTYSHGRHIHVEKLINLGLKIDMLEEDDRLQDLVLTVHHAYMHTFQNSNAIKIVENDIGSATILNARPENR